MRKIVTESQRKRRAIKMNPSYLHLINFDNKVLLLLFMFCMVAYIVRVFLLLFLACVLF